MYSLAPQEFRNRRNQLLQQMPANSIAVLVSAPCKVRSKDTEYLYRQDSNFFYLTGFNEPDSGLILVADTQEVIFFCRPKNKKEEIWHGVRYGLDKALEELQVDKVLAINEFPVTLVEYIAKVEHIFYSFSTPYKLDQQIMSNIQQLGNKRYAQLPINLQNIDEIIHEMRICKSPQELQLITHACDISVKAHLRAMRYCRAGMYEYELEAEIFHEYMKNGVRSPAYTNIVASGANCCILHYTSCDRKIENDDLVLIDSGCEWHGYAADITRTFPIIGKFSHHQRLIYELVLQAQLAAIKIIRPGVSWNEPQTVIQQIFAKGLFDLGILSSPNESILPFYMHYSGHFLGLDVHDTGKTKHGKEWILFKPGMVLTVEPGLYISADEQSVSPKWRGIGVRIEDDVLVTEHGCRVLTESLPKEIDEIEACMQA